MYRTIIVNGVFGGYRPTFFEVIVYTDEIQPNGALAVMPPDLKQAKIRRTLQCRLYFDPLQAKSFHNWLGQNLKRFEQRYGEIKMPARADDTQTMPNIA